MSLVLKMLNLYFHYTKNHKGPANALILLLSKMCTHTHTHTHTKCISEVALKAILFEYKIIYSTKQNSLSASKEKQL